MFNLRMQVIRMQISPSIIKNFLILKINIISHLTLGSPNRIQFISWVLSIVRRKCDEMKIIGTLVVFTCLILSFHQLSAQDFTIGGAIGLNTPSIFSGGSDNPLNTGNSFNFRGDIGVYGEYKVVDSDSYSFSLGLNYSSLGGIYRLKYLLVPILVRQNWILNDQSKFYVGAGPFGGYLLDRNLTSYPGILINTNKFNAGIGAIAGISHNFNDQGAFFIEVGSDYGFVRLQKPITQMTGHMFSFMIKVGYSFSLVPKQHKNRYQAKPFRKWRPTNQPLKIS